LTERITILTIDLEDWFHILDNEATCSEQSWSRFESRIEEVTDMLLALLAKHEVAATFFILGWVAAQFPHVVRKVYEAGHEIACHSDSHQLVYEMTPDAFKRDTEAALDHIEAACGIRPRAYRAPGFSVTANTPWVFDILADAGIEYDCSVFPAPRAHGGLEGYGAGVPGVIRTSSGKEVREFPMNYHNWFGLKLVYGGGGYFRLIPSWLGRAMFRATDYNMTYFHPRDFDTAQPNVPGLSPVRRFKSYVGIKGARAKLERLIEAEKMMTLGQAAARIDWDVMTRIEVGKICNV
jgi:polysaccharide deacetylase family protein (PEP-CTERM system associated)